MRPLRIVAHLSSAPAADPPVMLDGLLFYAACAAIAERDYAGQVVPEHLLIEPGRRAVRGVLAPVSRAGLTWRACSGATPPQGATQETEYVKRSPDRAALLRWTRAVSVDEKAGPDKLIRRPRYYWPGWLRMEWTCVGDPAAIRALLWRPDGGARVPGIGPGIGQGRGWVDRWEVSEDDAAPPVGAYAEDVRLRPIPLACAPRPPVGCRVVVHPRPIEAPYWERSQMIPCMQIVRSA